MPRRVLPRRPVRRRGLAGHPRHPAGRAGGRRGASHRLLGRRSGRRGETARRARIPRLRHGRHHAAAEPGTRRHPHRTLRPAQRPPVATRPVPARVRVRWRAAARFGPVTSSPHKETTMHPSGRTGVRFVLANPSDPSRLDDFKDWYDTYSAAITVPGYLANDARVETTSPRYATTYDIVSPDPATAWPDTEHSPAYPTHLFSDPRASLVTPALRASYALVGSQHRPGQHGPLTGIHVILSNGAGDTERQHREAQILQTGLFYSAARFRLIEGSPNPAEWLEVFETGDPDPLHAYPQAAGHTLPAPQIHPQLSQSFRLAGAPRAVGSSSPSITVSRAAAHVTGG